MTYKILITGSRTWTDRQTIIQALKAEYYAHMDSVMINGDCPDGADAICKQVWLNQNLPIELYPADWKRYGKRAGFVRNAEMVAQKPDICLAFIKEGSKGASMTARLAEEAGIKTVRYEE